MNDINQKIYQSCSTNLTDSSSYMNRIVKNSIFNDIFVALVKASTQKCLFFKMYLCKDRAENGRGPSKTPKDDKYVFKLYKNRGRSC